jgi:hypothetical protein
MLRRTVEFRDEDLASLDILKTRLRTTTFSETIRQAIRLAEEATAPRAKK